MFRQVHGTRLLEDLALRTNGSEDRKFCCVLYSNVKMPAKHMPAKLWEIQIMASAQLVTRILSLAPIIRQPMAASKYIHM